MFYFSGEFPFTPLTILSMLPSNQFLVCSADYVHQKKGSIKWLQKSSVTMIGRLKAVLLKLIQTLRSRSMDCRHSLVLHVLNMLLCPMIAASIAWFFFFKIPTAVERFTLNHIMTQYSCGLLFLWRKFKTKSIVSSC